MAPNSQPQCQNRKSRVFLVDDHPVVREGLTSLINGQSDMAVCGQASGGFGLLEAINNLRPDILVIDISLEDVDGIGLIKMIHNQRNAAPVLVLSMHDESTYAERALRAGAKGYIMKQDATQNVLVAIRRVLRGEIYLSDNLKDRTLQHLLCGTPPPEEPFSGLSDREFEIFRMIGAGLGTREIADELHISMKTVEAHQANIKRKLGLRSGRELVKQAIEWSVVEKQP